jgi:hypothetical protein
MEGRITSHRDPIHFVLGIARCKFCCGKEQKYKRGKAKHRVWSCGFS